MSRALVLGASGYIGTHLVPKLLAAGRDVRAASRRLDALLARQWDGAELREADVLDPATLQPAMRDVDVVYYLVHSMASGADFAVRDRRAARNVAEAAADAGVKRIIYVGGMPPATGGAEPSRHLASRLETGDVLREGTVPVTEIRAGIVVGAGSAAFEVIRDLVYHLPLMVAPRWVSSRSQPIALDDLLEYLARAPELPAGTYDAAGPETLSYADLLRRFAAIAGRRVRVITVPVLTPRLSSYWLDLVTAVPSSVARPLIDGLTHDIVSQHPEALRRLAPIELQTYEQAVHAALAEEAAGGPAARWTEGAFAYRNRRHDIGYYSKSARREAACAAPADAVWREIVSIGGDNGWYFWTNLWRLRGAVDRLFGGVGMRRGRRRADELRVGDPLDFWRVAEIEDGRRLTLVAEMKLPGSAVLELEAEPRDEGEDEYGGGGSAAILTARFHPAGAPGLLYWHALTPIHDLIFSGLTREIARRAERAQRRGISASTSNSV